MGPWQGPSEVKNPASICLAVTRRLPGSASGPPAMPLGCIDLLCPFLQLSCPLLPGCQAHCQPHAPCMCRRPGLASAGGGFGNRCPPPLTHRLAESDEGIEVPGLHKGKRKRFRGAMSRQVAMDRSSGTRSRTKGEKGAYQHAPEPVTQKAVYDGRLLP